MCMCTAMDAYKTTRRRRRLAKQPREAERIAGERFGGLSERVPLSQRARELSDPSNRWKRVVSQRFTSYNALQ